MISSLLSKMHIGALLTIPVFLVGCDAYVEKAKYDDVQKKSNETAKKLADAEEQLQKARHQIGEYQAHHYQMFKEGFRTWRLDTVNGTSCIMLTTDSDWKKPETKHQSCSCEDLYRDGSTPSVEVLRYMGCIE
jgi:hypothetical protein